MQSSASGPAWSPHSSSAAERMSHWMPKWALPEQTVKTEPSAPRKVALRLPSQTVLSLLHFKKHMIFQPLEKYFDGVGKV